MRAPSKLMAMLLFFLSSRHSSVHVPALSPGRQAGRLPPAAPTADQSVQWPCAARHGEEGGGGGQVRRRGGRLRGASGDAQTLAVAAAAECRGPGSAGTFACLLFHNYVMRLHAAASGPRRRGRGGAGVWCHAGLRAAARRLARCVGVGGGVGPPRGCGAVRGARRGCVTWERAAAATRQG